MQNQPIDKTADPTDPLLDTWGGKKDAGSWGVTPSFDFTNLSIQSVNTWYVNSLMETLNAFSDLARVWSVFFYPSPESEIKGVVLEWKPGDSYGKYLKKILEAIGEYSAAIEGLEMFVDLLVFVRTQESSNQPVRAWVRNLGNLVIWGGLEYGRPYLFFSVHHTLFYPFSYHNSADNSELYGLNQPLLENALRRLSERFGPISEVEGLKGIYEYGFKPKKEWYGKPIN